MYGQSLVGCLLLYSLFTSAAENPDGLDRRKKNKNKKLARTVGSMDSRTMEVSISIERHQSKGYTYVDVPTLVD